MKDILEKINLLIPDEQETINEKDSDYEKFFKQKLKEWGVKSPDELSKADQKKFFAEIKREWKK